MGIGYELLLFDGLDEVDGLLHFHLLNVADMFTQQDVVATVKLELVEEATLWESVTFLERLHSEWLIALNLIGEIFPQVLIDFEFILHFRSIEPTGRLITTRYRFCGLNDFLPNLARVFCDLGLQLARLCL